jgi:hypothetical protein
MEKIIHDIETDQVIIEKLSAKEVKEIEAQAAESLALQTARIEEDEVRSAARAALLKKLGITEDEARLLLG